MWPFLLLFSTASALVTREPPVPAPRGRDLVEEMWVDVRLDHFHASNVDTFPMRFYYNPEFATTGDHILIYVGGEWSISPGWLRAGLMYEAAADAGAAMFYTEHRYYGKTRPTEARRAGQLLAVQHRLARCAQVRARVCPEVYNALPTEIKDAPSLPAFKQYLKRWLVQHAFYTVGEFISRKT
ncbi:unnamed protein product [Plutella xylostella]|uniref:(diamondback moth) hypothetical protein n=1 Tax=Plutella xylostella TaxID=51655 RepID=A0A8S4GAS8_PLUXY|nr:unnamed protein product [Plutella xylostella]